MCLLLFRELLSSCFWLALHCYCIVFLASFVIWWLSLVVCLHSFPFIFCVFAIGFCFVFTMRLTYNNLQLNFGASFVAQSVKSLPAVQETWVQCLGWEDPLEKEMETHSSILAWKISRTEEPGGLQSMGSQRVGHDWATNTYLPTGN